MNMSAHTGAYKIAKEYLERFPDHDTQTIARILITQEPETFRTKEQARTAVRYLRGNHGANNRKTVKDKAFLRPNGQAGQLPRFPASIAPADHSTVELQYQNIGIVSDIHVPYHNSAAILAALNWLKGAGVDCLLLNGDILDCCKISTFGADPRRPGLIDEIRICSEFLAALREMFPAIPIIYREGNHEERIERYLMLKAPELFGAVDVSLNTLLGLPKLGIEHIRHQRILKAGKLNILHGHERRAGLTAPVNAARGIWLFANENCLVGHHHKTSEHAERNLSGDQFGTWSTGCLCDNQEYDWFAKWNHGFARVETSGAGAFRVYNHRILNGEVY